MAPSNLKRSVTSLALGLSLGLGITAVAAAHGNRQADDRRKSDVSYDSTFRFCVYREGNSYKTDGRGAALLRAAVTEGYRRGYAGGRADSTGGERSNWSRSDEYGDGTNGYEPYVKRGQYKYYFRRGFELGYHDGYKGHSDYGYIDGGKLHLMVAVINRLMTVVRY